MAPVSSEYLAPMATGSYEAPAVEALAPGTLPSFHHAAIVRYQGVRDRFKVTYRDFSSGHEGPLEMAAQDAEDQIEILSRLRVLLPPAERPLDFSVLSDGAAQRLLNSPMMRRLCGPTVHDVLLRAELPLNQMTAIELPEAEHQHLGYVVLPRLREAIAQEMEDVLFDPSLSYRPGERTSARAVAKGPGTVAG